MLQRELLERWRGRRAVTALTIYLSLLAAALYGLYRLGVRLIGTMSDQGELALAGPALGRFLLENLLFLMLTLVLFVVPGYAAAQLVGERERRTLPLLQVTLLRPSEIVAGKLAAAIAWVALLVVAVGPLAAATLMLGGVTVLDVVRSVGSIMATMIGVGGLALGISAISRRTATAVVLTYATVLMLVVGTAIAAIVMTIVSPPVGAERWRPPLVLNLNPFYGLADAANATNPAMATEVLPSPLGVISIALPDSPAFEENVVEGPAGEQPAASEQPAAHGRRSQPATWLTVAGAHLLLGAAGFALATSRLRHVYLRPSRRRSNGARA